MWSCPDPAALAVSRDVRLCPRSRPLAHISTAPQPAHAHRRRRRPLSLRFYPNLNLISLGRPQVLNYGLEMRCIPQSLNLATQSSPICTFRGPATLSTSTSPFPWVCDRRRTEMRLPHSCPGARQLSPGGYPISTALRPWRIRSWPCTRYRSRTRTRHSTRLCSRPCTSSATLAAVAGVESMYLQGKSVGKNTGFVLKALTFVLMLE